MIFKVFSLVSLCVFVLFLYALLPVGVIKLTIIFCVTVTYHWLFVAMQDTSLQSLMADLQSVYSDDATAESYQLRVPVVGMSNCYVTLLDRHRGLVQPKKNLPSCRKTCV